jgi:hypothetical protein
MKATYAALLLLLASPLVYGEVVTVDAHSGPWNPGVNAARPYGRSDQAAPASVVVLPGEVVMIGNATGQVCADQSGLGPYGPDGYVNNPWGPNNGRDYTDGIHYPSRYVPSSEYPVYLMALLGTFADPNGKVVGAPFKIGSQSLRLTVPAGAARLLLGVEDDRYSDNSGSFTVQVERLAVTIEGASVHKPDNPCEIEIDPKTGESELVCGDKWGFFKVRVTMDGVIYAKPFPMTIKMSDQPNGPWTVVPNVIQSPDSDGAIQFSFPFTSGKLVQFFFVYGDYSGGF